MVQIYGQKTLYANKNAFFFVRIDFVIIFATDLRP